MFFFAVVKADDSEEEEDELGGLFRVSLPQKSKKVQANTVDCSCFTPDTSHNWDLEEVMYFSDSTHHVLLSRRNFKKTVCFLFQMLNSIRDCFVTGKWEEQQDASTLLKQDGKKSLKRTACYNKNKQLKILAVDL